MNKMISMPTCIAATIFAALLPLSTFAAPAARSAGKAAQSPKALMYRAQCGMTYTAAEAEKDHYICPMDHKKMMPMAQPKAAPAGHKKQAEHPRKNQEKVSEAAGNA